MLAPLALALLAAGLLGTSAALQRHALAGLPDRGAGGATLLRRAAGRPLWWAGTACSAGALAAQFTALRLGPLLLVQVVLLLGVVASALVEQLVLGARPGARARAGTVLTTAGLAGLLVTLEPTSGAAGAAPPTAALLRLAVAFAAAVVLARVLQRRSGSALGLAVATGGGYGLTAIALKAVGAQATLGWGEPLAHGALWVAVLVGPSAVALSQHALAGSRSAAVTVSTIATTELGVVTAGSAWFGEHVSTSTPHVLLALAAGAAALVGLALGHAPTPPAPGELELLPASVREPADGTAQRHGPAREPLDDGPGLREGLGRDGRRRGDVLDRRGDLARGGRGVGGRAGHLARGSRLLLDR